MRTRARIEAAALAGALAVGALAACKNNGASSSSSPSSTENAEAGLAAKAYFESTVFPVIQPACGSCHSGSGGGGSTFLGPDADSSYTLLENSLGLIADPSRSPLVQHVHLDPTVVLSPNERNVLSEWLGMEVTARGLAGSIVQAASPQDAYTQFANCMNFDVWEYYRVGDMAFSQTDQDGPCMSCHSVGQGSAWLSADSRETFQQVKLFPYIQKWIVATVDDNGNFNGLQPALRFIEKQDEVCQNPDRTQCHPTYGLSPNVEDAIKGFINTTLQNLAAGTCQNGIAYVPDAGTDGDADAN
jgi:hypothetical protein